MSEPVEDLVELGREKQLKSRAWSNCLTRERLGKGWREIGKSPEKRLMRKDMTEVYQLTKVVGKGGLPGGGPQI